MAEEFVDERFSTPEPKRDREPVRLMIVGSRQGVVNIIHTLYAVRFAEIHEWSEPRLEPNSHRFMSVMTKYSSPR